MNKTAIITGGGRGIGESISRAFHDAGYYVVIGSRDNSGLSKDLGPRAKFFKVDVRREVDHTRLISTALTFTGRLDAYINCAGYSGWKPLDEMTPDFLDDMLDTNLKGTMWGCKAAAQAMKPGGVIINISSLAGKRGSANNAAYCASKFGVTGLTQALAKELGPKGIRVNAVCPVYVETPGLLKALGDKNSPAKGKNIRAYLKQFADSQSALGRLPTGQDVAQACLFLASPAASAITGQSVNVDCGVLPQ